MHAQALLQLFLFLSATSTAAPLDPSSLTSLANPGSALNATEGAASGASNPAGLANLPGTDAVKGLNPLSGGSDSSSSGSSDPLSGATGALSGVTGGSSGSGSGSSSPLSALSGATGSLPGAGSVLRRRQAAGLAPTNATGYQPAEESESDSDSDSDSDSEDEDVEDVSAATVPAAGAYGTPVPTPASGPVNPAFALPPVLETPPAAIGDLTQGAGAVPALP